MTAALATQPVVAELLAAGIPESWLVPSEFPPAELTVSAWRNRKNLQTF
ncbi:hypothetical protein ACMHYT_30335 [Rhodococcus qingshengii]